MSCIRFKAEQCTLMPRFVVIPQCGGGAVFMFFMSMTGTLHILAVEREGKLNSYSLIAALMNSYAGNSTKNVAELLSSRPARFKCCPSSSDFRVGSPSADSLP